MKDLSEKNQIVRGNEREVGSFVEKKKWKLESWRECEEMREMKRMKKKTKMVGNRWKKFEEVGMYWWLNYM